MTNRIVLGINDAHNPSVCLLKDGKILGCISEERLRRIKGYNGFPELSIRQLLSDHEISPEEISLVAFTSKDIVPADLNRIVQSRSEKRKTVLAFSYIAKYSPFFATEKLFSPVATKMMQFIKKMIYSRAYKPILDRIGITTKNIKFYDHHMVHAYSAYFFKGVPRSECLIFTCDGEGDGLCASVCIGSGGKVERKISIPFVHSIAKMYNEVTWYLGLKPWEHEYKVMGLAPYAKKEYCERTLQIFNGMASIDPKNKLKFRNNSHAWAHTYGLLLKKKLYKERFDAIAFGIQTLTEKILIEWIRNNIRHFGIGNVMLAGGIFMNVKANQKIYEMPEVKSLFIVPSAGDESTAIGASMMGFAELCKEDGILARFEPIDDVYLGPSYEDATEDLVKKINGKKFRVSRCYDISGNVAELLSKGEIVARFSGRMEFGARALGNRSILADPRDLGTAGEINRMVKMRDFWMPFAPSILRQRKPDYLKTSWKKVNDQYMIISFDSTPLARNELKAAIHQADFTCRPQVVDKDFNSEYHKIIKKFENITGVGGVLNTSFNIHGEPIVCSPQDALSTFERSGLKYLVLENYLIEKI